MAITTVRWSSIGNQKKFRSFAEAAYIAPTPSTMGMVLLTPTSIAHSGTSASIGANGQVTFTAVTSLSLNGVFSATYDNYMVSTWVNAASSTGIDYRLRASGTDNSTANSYTRQYIGANSTTVNANRTTSDVGNVFATYGAQRSGTQWMLYGPFLAQPTAVRSIPVLDSSSARMEDHAGTHNQSTSYDGFTFIAGVAITGVLQVYGVRS